MILFVDDNAGILFIKNEIVAEVQVIPVSGSHRRYEEPEELFDYSGYRRKKDEEELIIILKIAVQWLR